MGAVLSFVHFANLFPINFLNGYLEGNVQPLSEAHEKGDGVLCARLSL